MVQNERQKCNLLASGAMKCVFFIPSLHVLTCWWIASGATNRRYKRI